MAAPTVLSFYHTFYGSTNLSMSLPTVARDVFALHDSAIPKKGEVVAIDAEFVSLGAEETEVRDDGSRAVVSLALCLRLFLLSFFHSYIH